MPTSGGRWASSSTPGPSASSSSTPTASSSRRKPALDVRVSTGTVPLSKVSRGVIHTSCWIAGGGIVEVTPERPVSDCPNQ